MKRRRFLALTALLPLLFPGTALAARRKAAKETQPARKATKKTPKRPAARTSRAAAPSAEGERTSRVARPAEEVVEPWRTYELSTTLRLHKMRGPTRVWVPLAQATDSAWQRSRGRRWDGNFSRAEIVRDPVADMEVLVAEWNSPRDCELRMISQVMTRDRHFDISRYGAAPTERNEVLRRCLQPLAGGVEDSLRNIATEALGRIRDPLARGKALYDWVIDNARYETQPPGGCGSGNLAAMLEKGRYSGIYAGKSADIALLFVGLCRSIGMPARPVFGVRVDSSRLFSSLGRSGELAQAQHCRAEFYAPGWGWVPVDPADVLTAIAEGSVGTFDPRLNVLRKLLFGFWEMNWIGLNSANEFNLRNAAGHPVAAPAAPLPFLAYPYVESADGRFSILDRDRVSYSLSARRIDIGDILAPIPTLF